MTKIIKLILSAFTLALTILATTYWAERIYSNKTTNREDHQIIKLYFQKLGKLYYGVLFVLFIGLFNNCLILFSNFYDYPINEGWKVANSIFTLLLIVIVPLKQHYEKLVKQKWETNNKKTNGCYSCGNKTTKTYFNLNYYNSITTSYEPVYLCNSSRCKCYLLNILKRKDCPSHRQFTNITSIPQTEWDFYKKYLNDHDI